MSQSPTLPVIRRFWKPVAVIGAGSSAFAVWFDKILLYVEEILGLIILSIMAGMINLIVILMFKSRFPKRDDPKI